MKSLDQWTKLTEYLTQYESALGYVHFNAVVIQDGKISVSSVPNVRKKSEDILGNKTVEMLFMVHMIKAYDTEMSYTNTEAMEDALKYMQWFETQEEDKNYPDFGNNIKPDKLEVLSNVPTIMIDSENNLAQYQFQVRYTYIEEV